MVQNLIYKFKDIKLSTLLKSVLLWLVVSVLLFVIMYFDMLRHYLMCPLSCNSGCFCLSTKRTHMAGLEVLWQQIKLTIVLEGFWSMALLLLLSLAITINIIILYKLYKKEQAIYKKNSMLTIILTSIGALFGGCLSCNLALLYPILTALGLTSVIAVLPWHGKEIILLSAVFLYINAYFLYKRYKRGLVGRLK